MKRILIIGDSAGMAGKHLALEIGRMTNMVHHQIILLDDEQSLKSHKVNSEDAVLILNDELLPSSLELESIFGANQFNHNKDKPNLIKESLATIPFSPPLSRLERRKQNRNHNKGRK